MGFEIGAGYLVSNFPLQIRKFQFPMLLHNDRKDFIRAGVLSTKGQISRGKRKKLLVHSIVGVWP